MRDLLTQACWDYLAQSENSKPELSSIVPVATDPLSILFFHIIMYHNKNMAVQQQTQGVTFHLALLRNGHRLRYILRRYFLIHAAVFFVVGGMMFSRNNGIAAIRESVITGSAKVYTTVIVDPTAVAAVKITTLDDDDVDTSKKAASTEELFVLEDGQFGLVPAPSSGSIAHQNMDAMCTLKRYTHLFGKFCDPVDRSICDLEAFKAYFAIHSAKENLIGGCPLQDAVCYAKRYPDVYRVYCQGGDAKCNYYSLRNHFERHGMKERRAWGCDYFQPIQPAANVSRQQPAVTVDKLPVSTKRENVLGKASLKVFQGSWEPVEFNQDNVPSKSICPKTTKFENKFCNFTARQGWQPAQYVASSLPEWSAKRFQEALTKDGDSIAFVGDSLMLQNYHELQCLAEAEQVDIDNNLKFYRVTLATIPESIQEQWEVRAFNHEKLKLAFSLEWIDQAIADKVKYIVYNTGAWWNPNNYRERAEWCNYTKWRKATQEELISIFTEAMYKTMLPIFTFLVQNHGVIPVWRDSPPAGNINLTTGEHFHVNAWADNYQILHRFNEIGRQMMVAAGGLVLPIWDASYPRYMDHKSPTRDQLHWCAQYHNSVPAVWVQLLSQVLFGNHIEIKAANSSTTTITSTNETKSSLRSLQQQGIQEENRRTAMEQRVPGRDFKEALAQGHRSLLGQHPSPIMRFSRSNQSPCGCAGAKVDKHCQANIRCSWSTESATCSERS
jgi:GDSL/SGNH-like Acyl-Esterase family found in Pmr5 and Cas1p